MKTYYVINDNQIVLFDTDKSKIEKTLKFLPQYSESEVLETEKEIVELDEKFFFKEDVQDILDEKRIRAVCEPSMKDDDTTWLEYYNQEVYKLREQLKNI